MKNRIACIALFAPALAGCISLPMKSDGPAPTIYTLHTAPAASAGKSVNAAIVVPKPDLPPGYQTDRIAIYFEKGHRLDYYADAKWSAPLDELLQDFFIREFQRKLPGKTVGTPDLDASARARMSVKIIDFEPVYAGAADAPPHLNIAMTVTIVSVPGEKVQAQFTVKRTVPASANTMSAVTRGLETLLRSVTDEALERAKPYLPERHPLSAPR